MAFAGNGKQIIYMDESNCNLFLRRTFGRSRKGTRCTIKTPASKGKNIHVIAAITQTGLVHWERKRGSFLKRDCQEWLRNMLRKVLEPMCNVVVVLDNAPVHSDLEIVLEEEEFNGCTLLRLAPYSAPLNPIEECWSVFKSHMKREISSSLVEMLSSVPDPQVTQTEHRMRYLEAAIDKHADKITPNVCMKIINHVQRHFSSCLAKQDLKIGGMLRSS